MTLLRSLIKTFESISRTRACFTFSLNNYNAECYFGSKVEVPSPPKRPLSAYMIFCKENRKEILQNNPSLSTTDQIKLLAEKWSHLTEDMKKPYELTARQGTQLYGIEHKKFYESLSEEQKEELARLKARKREARRIFRLRKALQESGVPKAPNSSYALFIKSEAKRHPSVKSGVEFIKKAADTWNALPEATKKHFEKQAQEDKERYVKEMKEWHTKMLAEGNQKVVKAFEELSKRGKSVLLMNEDEIDTSKKKTKSEGKPSAKAKSAP